MKTERNGGKKQTFPLRVSILLPLYPLIFSGSYLFFWNWGYSSALPTQRRTMHVARWEVGWITPLWSGSGRSQYPEYLNRSGKDISEMSLNQVANLYHAQVFWVGSYLNTENTCAQVKKKKSFKCTTRSKHSLLSVSNEWQLLICSSSTFHSQHMPVHSVNTQWPTCVQLHV